MKLEEGDTVEFARRGSIYLGVITQANTAKMSVFASHVRDNGVFKKITGFGVHRLASELTFACQMVPSADGGPVDTFEIPEEENAQEIEQVD